MKRAEWLQEIRRSVWRLAWRALTQEEAASLMGVCVRTFRRYTPDVQVFGFNFI